MNVNNNNRLNNDKINNNIQSIEKDVANLEYKLVKHIEFNELDTKVRDEEISKLKNKLEQMNSNTNINSNSSNIQNVYRGNSTNHNNNNRLISSINSRNNNFNIQQQPGYLKDDDFTVESDEEEPMINIDQNQILEKQLKASNLDEPEIMESVDKYKRSAAPRACVRKNSSARARPAKHPPVEFQYISISLYSPSNPL